MKKHNLILASLAGVVLLAGCGESNADNGKVEIEFFSNKVENTSTYQSMIEKFEEEHPDIEVSLYAPPDAETLLRTRLVKDDMPDVVALAGSSLYGELAESGLLVDYEDSELLEDVQPAYLEMLNNLEGEEIDGLHGVPYAANANVVIYNKEKMEALDGEIPATWDEFIALMEEAQAEGEIPIYFTLQDAWTGMVPWNGIAGNLEPEQFAEKKSNGEASFESDYEETAVKIQELLNYGHERTFGIGYDDGNRAFANGEGLFYLQGNWAIPELLAVNPDAELGVFPLPATNNPEENKLVSGVDVLLAGMKDSEHQEEVNEFITFMTEEEQSAQYMDEQAAFSVLEGVYTDDPVMDGIQESFETGSLTSFPDHYYPPGMGAENLIQEFMYRGNNEEFLKRMDEEWEKIELRY